MIIDQEFPDRKNDGIPDAFENRPSIIEILNDVEQSPVASSAYRVSVPQGGQLVVLNVNDSKIVFRSRFEVRDLVSELSKATLAAFGEAQIF